MNESTVTFWQMMMVLQILVMAKIVQFEAGMTLMLKRMWAFLAARINFSGFRKKPSEMFRSVRGKKI